MEEYKKEQENEMKNKKEIAKKQYEEENRILKTYGNNLSSKNRENYKKLKLAKEELKKKEQENDKEFLEQKKNKMLSVKNKNNDNDRDTNKSINIEKQENENNEKMNYVYTARAVEELKSNIDELERLEKEYIRRIEECRQGKETKKPRVFSAVKINKKSKLNDKDNDKEEKKRGETSEKNTKVDNKEKDKYKTNIVDTKKNKGKTNNIKPFNNKSAKTKKNEKE